MRARKKNKGRENWTPPPPPKEKCKTHREFPLRASSPPGPDCLPEARLSKPSTNLPKSLKTNVGVRRADGYISICAATARYRFPRA